MSLLSYTELVGLIDEGFITKVTRAQVNSSSIDLTLGDKILYERPKERATQREHTIFLKNREALDMLECDLEKPFHLYPGQFVLAHTEQVFHLPLHISAEYKLKSSLARSGLEHLNAGWCDAGWNNSVLTLELKNMTQEHILVLERGMPIGQIVFFHHKEVPHHRSYAARGRYNNDTTVSGIKI